MLKKFVLGASAMLVGLTGALAADEITFQDDFTGYSMKSHGEPNWAIHSGCWEFLNGTIHHTDQMFNGGVALVDGKSFSDCTVKVKFKPEGNKRFVRAAGVIFRARDCKNFYWIHYDCKNSQVVFARRSSNKVWIVIHRAEGVTISPDVWHDAEVSAIGTKITAKLDGKVVLEAEDKTFREGRVGLRSGMGLLSFDDFTVTGTPVDDSKFVMTYESLEDEKTRRIEVPRVIASTHSGYFPVMVHLGGSKLGAVVRAGAAHVGIGGYLAWIASEDGGRTWSKPATIVNSKWDDRNPALFVTKDGKIVLIYCENSAYNEKGEYNQKFGTFDLFQTESADGGKTWSPKKAIKFDGHENSSVYGQGITLSNGDILVPWYWKGGGYIRSTDGGKTWQPPVRIAPCSEVAFVEIAPNELFAIARRGEGLWTLRSKDNGVTWTEPVRLTPEGIHPATVLKLANGNLFMACGSRIRPYGIKVAVSKDNGVTWKAENTAFISWDSGNTDSGYPSAVQLPDGSVAIISYALGSKLLPMDSQSQCAILSPEILSDLSK